MDQAKKWYLAKCTMCVGEVEYGEDKFKCNKCNRLIPHPRRRYIACCVIFPKLFLLPVLCMFIIFLASFCVETLCSDHTGTVTVILPHCQVTKIVHKNVEDLYSLEKEVVYLHYPDNTFIYA